MKREATVEISGTFIIENPGIIDLSEYLNYYKGTSGLKIELHPFVRITLGEKEIGFKGHIHTVEKITHLHIGEDVITFLKIKKGDEIKLSFKFKIFKMASD